MHQAVRLYVNYFQPSFQLRSKVRDGAKVRKAYHRPATPCDRLLAHAAVPEGVKTTLRAERDGLDPLRLLHRARECQAALAALSSGNPGDGPARDSLEEFLGQLSDLWRAGDARPTHRPPPRRLRHWRTHKDAFEGVWVDIQGWLQAEPEINAKVILGRLQQADPVRFPDGHLRTLQRRVREWRRVLARELVHGTAGRAEDAGAVAIGREPRESGSKTAGEEVGTEAAGR